MPYHKDLTGLQFGRLTVLRDAGSIQTNSGGKRAWVCQCTCGNQKTAFAEYLKAGRTRSCGCLQVESRFGNQHSVIHSGSHSSEYSCWGSMLHRCRAANSKDFPRYGGRGITVCDRWLSFENFLSDMGPRPSPAHSVDRYPNRDGNYEPGNCRWATPQMQSANRHTSIEVTLNGRTECVAAWARILGISRSSLYTRISRGMSPLQAILKGASR